MNPRDDARETIEDNEALLALICSSCIPPARTWEALSGGGWLDFEREHLDSCPSCRKYAARVQTALGPAQHPDWELALPSLFQALRNEDAAKEALITIIQRVTDPLRRKLESVLKAGNPRWIDNALDHTWVTVWGLRRRKDPRPPFLYLLDIAHRHLLRTIEYRNAAPPLTAPPIDSLEQVGKHEPAGQLDMAQEVSTSLRRFAPLTQQDEKNHESFMAGQNPNSILQENPP